MSRLILLIGSVLLAVVFKRLRTRPRRASTLDRSHAAPGEIITLHGHRLKDLALSPAALPPILKGCAEYRLEALEWLEDRLRLRVPRDIPAGSYEVEFPGLRWWEHLRPSAASLRLWVTCASVPHSTTDAYEAQVKSFRLCYGKSDEWESWMLANRGRYEAAFAIVQKLPCPIRIAVSYETPLGYNPPWISEAHHMAALNRMANAEFPGYTFDFSLNHLPSSAYGQTVLGHPGWSHASGTTVVLHYETIFGHEFGHVLGLLHHYDDDDSIGKGQHFPPGERGCTMDRTEPQFCSACRTALNLPLNVDNWTEINAAMDDILTRYPPGW